MKTHRQPISSSEPPASAGSALRSPHISRFTFHVSRPAFTLLELLVVISIIGILAALAVPVLNNFKPNYTASATRQLLDDIGRARQLAISRRTTVYMIFAPTNFWTDPAIASWKPNPDWVQASNLYDKQLIGYTYVTLRSVGDQPGRWTTNYLSSWKTLPEGAFIPPAKFGPYNPNQPVMMVETNQTPAPQYVPVYGFWKTDRYTKVPFPTADTAPASPAHPFVDLPYLAFDYMGRLVHFNNGVPVYGIDEVLPLAKGSVVFGRAPGTKAPTATVPTFDEKPPGNATNAYNLVCIDWLTGRARVVYQEVK